MADERDAFGRSQDEDSGLGWPSSHTPSPEDTPPPKQQTSPDQWPRPSSPRRRRSGAPRAIGGVVVVLAGVGAILLAGNSGTSSSTTADGTSVPTQAEPEERGKGGGVVPVQVRVRSFHTKAGLRAGMRLLAKEQPGRVSNFSVRSDRINLQVVRGGRTYLAQLDKGAEAPQELTSSSAAHPFTFSYEALSARAPIRLMRAANARLRESTSGVDYFTASRFSERLIWGVYYKSGKIAQGDSRGRYLRRIS